MHRKCLVALIMAASAVGLGEVAAQDSIMWDEAIIRDDFNFTILTYLPTVPSTVWKAELGTSGDWFDEDLWTEGVPSAELAVFFVNGSETLLDDGDAAARSLEFNRPSYGLSRLTQSGGRLTVEQAINIDDGVYRLTSGRLAAESMSIGVARFEIALANPDFSEVPKPEVPCLDAGNGICLTPLVLLASEKRFQLEGGEAEFTGSINVGQGQLEITEGRLKVAIAIGGSAVLGRNQG